MQLQLYGKKIWVFKKAIDFRASIDGLSAFIVNELQHDPQEGIYLFYNKRKDKIKCLSWHKNGFVLIYKRLEQGRFCFLFHKEQGVTHVSITELQWLFAGLEWQKMQQWDDLSFDKFD